MRNNNIYYKDYLNRLEEEGITPQQEIQDILELIKDKDGWYDEYREKLNVFVQHHNDDYIKVGRRKIDTQYYLVEVICMPVHRMTQLEKQRPWITEPLGDGRYSVKFDLTPEEKEECKLLHWLYLELGTVRYRMYIEKKPFA